MNQSAPDDDAKLDLDRAETKDAQVEIIKQIRRVNEDGSYTVGYEADDGTFKIESRDVLGNVKGTYGYVDENGEIKRVSYSANNASEKSSTTVAPTVEQVVHIPRQNRSTSFVASTTRRPVSVLTSSSPPQTRSAVVQPIPKRRILISSTSTTSQFSSSPKYPTERTTAAPPRKTDPTTTIVYATSMPQKQMVNGRSTTLPVTMFKSTELVPRPVNKLEIDRVSKVHVNQVLSTTEKPVVEIEKNQEKERERKPVHGNFLRRQLPDDNLENFEAQEQVVYSQSAGEDSNPLYGGVSGNVRHLFSTTSSPRIPSLVLAARQRASNLQKNTVTSAPQTTSTTERIYSKPPRRKQDRRVIEEPTTESTSENYLTQTPIPVQIPANRDQIFEEHENRVYRQPAYSPRSREYVRASTESQSGPRQFRIPIPRAYTPSTLANTPAEGDQYLRETTDATTREKASTTAEQEQYNAVEPTGPQQPAPFALPTGRQYLPYQQPYPTGYDQQQSYPMPYQNYGGQFYRPVPNPGSGYYGNNLDRPLTARDFERLLNILVFRQQQLQRYNYPQPNPFLYPGLGGFGGGAGGGFGGGAGGGYGPYNNGFLGYPPHVPRPPHFNPYDPRNGGYTRQPLQSPPYGTAIYNDDENMYQAQNPIPEQQVPYAGQRLVTRKRQYSPPNPQYYGAATAYQQAATAYPDDAQNQVQAPPLPIPLPGPQTDYLPPEVREELLYRMLMLAIHSERSMQEASMPQEYIKSGTTTTTAITPTKFKKPVRSVQILGEE